MSEYIFFNESMTWWGKIKLQLWWFRNRKRFKVWKIYDGKEKPMCEVEK